MLCFPSEYWHLSFDIRVLTKDNQILPLGLVYYFSSATGIEKAVTMLHDENYLYANMGAGSWKDLADYMYHSKPALVNTKEAVLSPGVTGTLVHEAIVAHEVSLEYVVKGLTNVFHPSKIGMQVIPPLMKIRDDPTLLSSPDSPYGFGSMLFDWDGVMSEPIDSIGEEGIFIGGYLSSRESAGTAESMYKKYNLGKSNGHARQEYIGRVNKPEEEHIGRIANSEEEYLEPEPRVTNIVIEPVKPMAETMEEMIDHLPNGGLVLYGGGGFVRPEDGSFCLQPSTIYEKTSSGRVMLNGGIWPMNKIDINDMVELSKEVDFSGGYCGADSGFVPTGEISPTSYFKRVAIQYETQEEARKLIK
jgi:predicted Zn-dependent protease